MKKYMYIALIVVAGLLALWTLASYVLERSVKTPPYTVVEKKEGYEVRAYGPYITAQVEVEGTYEQALNEGFKMLADYIFGNNTKQASIAMTAPVTESTSEKMAMTAPVVVRNSESLAMTAPVIEKEGQQSRVISFVMPFEYTLETLPKPNNSKVVIVPQEARRVAVLRFGWYAGGERVAEQKQKLIALLQKDGVVTKGAAEYAGYNALFTAPWLTRHEVLVEIE
jgi:hypothetical protein